MERGSPVAIPIYEDEKSYLEAAAMLPASERTNSISFAAYAANVEKLEQYVIKQGCVPYCIPVNAATIKAWCESNNQPFCRASISAFAASRLGDRILRSGSN